MISMVEEGYRNIQVICEDTDVVVLLLYHYDHHDLCSIDPPVDVMMQYPPSAPKVISVMQTINSLPSPPSGVVSSLLAAHVVSIGMWHGQYLVTSRHGPRVTIMVLLLNDFLILCLLSKRQLQRLEAFHQHCLRRILRIKWFHRVRNVDFLDRARINTSRNIHFCKPSSLVWTCFKDARRAAAKIPYQLDSCSWEEVSGSAKEIMA